jgi:crotonobetainyl-CoA:carnitine CoA-transferase CaiB-like acyl-CoA transferase
MVGFPGFPYKMSQTPAELYRPPPLLGEHNEEILNELLNYTREEVVHLKDQGAI